MGLSKRILANHGEIYIKTVVQSMHVYQVQMDCKYVCTACSVF